MHLYLILDIKVRLMVQKSLYDFRLVPYNGQKDCISATL